MKKEPLNRYADIINLPHHTSHVHSKMSRHNRAAQFAPFAALTGFDATITESTRQTACFQEVDDDDAAQINSCLQLIMESIKEKPFICVTYFVPDTQKEGGSYVTAQGNVNRIDTWFHQLYLTDGLMIPIATIRTIKIYSNTK